MSERYTSSYSGTQPRITQVPPIRYSSAIMTRAPWPAAIRASPPPPEPPPMTNRSTSNSAMSFPIQIGFLNGSDLLAALAHLGAKFTVDGFGEGLRPLIHIGHAELNCPRLGREQFLAERRLVKRDQVLQLLLGKLVGINGRHPVADFLFAAG